MAINQQTNPQALSTGMQLYASTFIEELSKRLVEVDGFARNFTDEMNQPGDTLNVPYVEGNTAGDFNESTNNFCTTTTEALKNVVVKLGEHPIIKFTVTPAMVANFTANYWEAKARLNANALADAILQEVAALPVSSKVTQSIELPKDTCTYTDVIDIAAKADSLNIRTREATLYLANAWTSASVASSASLRRLPAAASWAPPTSSRWPPSPTSASRWVPVVTSSSSDC